MNNGERKKKVLFLCTGNSCRSQMAEGLLNEMAGDRFEAHSAGMDPAQSIHPLAVQVMREVGIDITAQQPKSVDVYLGKGLLHYLIIVCDKANQSCPRIWPGIADERRLYWPLDDPAEVSGTDEDILAGFRSVRDQLKTMLEEWVKAIDE